MSAKRASPSGPPARPVAVKMTSSLRHFSARYTPASHTVIVPAPYWPAGMVPAKSRYSSGCGSVITARWLRSPTAGMPRGTAQLTSTPSRSSRRS